MSKAHEELVAVFKEVVFGCAVLAVFSIVLAAITANAAEKYVVNAFLVETTECEFSAKEQKTIEELKALARGRADLHVSSMTIEGKVKKVSVGDFRDKSKKKTQAKVITVALYPDKAGFPMVSYLTGDGYFLAATPKQALKLLKKYL